MLVIVGHDHGAGHAGAHLLPADHKRDLDGCGRQLVQAHLQAGSLRGAGGIRQYRFVGGCRHRENSAAHVASLSRWSALRGPGLQVAPSTRQPRGPLPLSLCYLEIWVTYSMTPTRSTCGDTFSDDTSCGDTCCDASCDRSACGDTDPYAHTAAACAHMAAGYTWAEAAARSRVAAEGNYPRRSAAAAAAARDNIRAAGAAVRDLELSLPEPPGALWDLDNTCGCPDHHWAAPGCWYP